MIRVHVSVVLAVRDGLTGQAVERGLLCRVDGVTVRPVAKPGGYWVFSDLTPGDHVLELSGGAYLPQRLEVHTGGRTRQELVVMLQPGPKYPFRGPLTVLEAALEPGECVWLAPQTPRYELKLAQDQTLPGDLELRLFSRCAVSQLALPRQLLLQDDGETEICTLWDLDGQVGRLSQPLEKTHVRGRSLWLAQCYTAPQTGLVRATLRQSGPVCLWQPGGALTQLELLPGENHIQLVKGRS